MSHRYQPGRSSNNYTWNDIVMGASATVLDSAAGKLDYNYDTKCIEIASTTTISDTNSKVHYAFQITHNFKLNGSCDAHIHWIQSSANVPNWWLRWRFYQNGKVAGSWTQAALSTNVFTYTSGTIMQISKPPSNIDLSTAVGGQLNVSDFIDVEITRDSNNASGLFAGADPLSGVASLRSFDMHLQVDSDGSDEEYNKAY